MAVSAINSDAAIRASFAGSDSDESEESDELDESDSSKSKLSDEASQSENKECKGVEPQEASQAPIGKDETPLKALSQPGEAPKTGLTLRLQIQKDNTASHLAATSKWSEVKNKLY
ncbi:hypothetical protein PCANC_28036 [Puccinia coronata f. sp. avenae]|uniref:Uncharacterized protein n=1 Tax=Puccinia coronata f. sp. avenae TaxID=200324 RepID=A0A2N5TE31_9BASI|nr:hypothetical protein PCANC_28036 [Puccinia coronata f. sp. avenae]